MKVLLSLVLRAEIERDGETSPVKRVSNKMLRNLITFILCAVNHLEELFL